MCGPDPKTEDLGLYHLDASQLLEELIQNNTVVDHIITDPPYNISKQDNFVSMASRREGLSFGHWDRECDYTWIKDYKRVLSSNGSLVVFCSYRSISYLIDEIEKAGLVMKDVLIWKKTNPMPRNTSRRYVQDTEYAVWAVNNKAKWVFNKPEDKAYLRAMYETPKVSGNERTFHPTQKSLKLLKDIISVHTNENELILDPFMGSGTTGVAAKSLNRRFIGCDIQKEFFDLSLDRIAKEIGSP
jgi:DNA modification methylase